MGGDHTIYLSIYISIYPVTQKYMHVSIKNTCIRMFIVALFITPQNTSQMSTNMRKVKLWYRHTQEYYTVTKMSYN